VVALFWLAEEQKADTSCLRVMRKSLTKTELIRYQPEIDRIFKQGKSQSAKGLKIIVRKNEIGWSRMIVIPVRHYGTAVERNKIRRQIKEIWRNEKERLVSGYDYAFVVYPGNAYDYNLLKQVVLTLCKKAGVLLSSEASSQLTY
jgi:ribonuclease P protein component